MSKVANQQKAWLELKIYRLLAGMLLLVSVSATNWAMDTVEVQCTACKFDKKFAEGTTMAQFSKNGLWQTVFFCEQKGEFIVLQAVRDPMAFQKANLLTRLISSPAQETAMPVAAGSEFKKWSHRSCLDGLIPLDYYRVQKAPTCPICRKGTLTFKTVGVITD